MSLSPYQPTTGLDSFGLQKALAGEKRKLMTKELVGCCTKPRPNLLDKFFPNPSESQPILDALGDKYGEVDRPTAKNPHGRRAKDHLKRGWKGRPKPPEGKEPPNYKENSIAAAFIPILNAIIAKLGRNDSRVAVDRQNVPILTRDGGALKPDIFLWGKGSSAFAPVDGTPSSRMGSKREVDTEVAHQGRGVSEDVTPIDWPWCVIPIEVKTDLERGGPENTVALNQLSTYVREVFTAQENRRFVPSLVLTECTVEFLVWDRAGVVASERLDYRTYALLFCHMLKCLVTWDDHQLGFDPNVFYCNEELHIQTREPAEYVIEETLVRSYTIRSRGSTCWRVRKLDAEGAPGTSYLIQDSWVKGGMRAENTILRRIEGVRPHVADGIPAVLPLVHIEEVRIEIPGSIGRRDTVLHNRREDSPMDVVDPVHTRTVLRCRTRDCVPLADFVSLEELVGALHDAIKGMFI